MAAEPRNVQKAFIQRLKESLPADVSLAEELADILKVSTDSAYRRIRGETALTIDEVSVLCNHYRIPFDPVSTDRSQGKATASFQYNHLSSDFKRFEEYLASLAQHMEMIRRAEPKEIIWTAEDVPIFHHFRFPGLAAFKLFYWAKSILNAPQYDDKKFNASHLPQELLGKVMNIYKLYNRIPSVEIWTEDTLNSTLKQVEYYWESGLFDSPNDAYVIIDEIESMVKGIEKQAAHSLKFEGEVPTAESATSFKMYFSDLMVGTNCISITAGPGKVCYFSMNTFNSMATSNPELNEEVDRWIANIIRKSTLISGVSEKQRMKFFKILFDKISSLRNKIGNN